jgi:hypothetical protein
MSFIQDGTCPEEFKKLGPLGPVDDKENLVRIVRTPQHVNKIDGSIKPGIVSRKDIQSKGVSVTRADKVKNTWLDKYANAVASQAEGQTLLGMCYVNTQEIRSERHTDGTRAFCVIEDPAQSVGNIPENQAHGAIVASTMIEDESEVIKLQQALFRIFKTGFVARGE